MKRIGILATVGALTLVGCTGGPSSPGNGGNGNPGGGAGMASLKLNINSLAGLTQQAALTQHAAYNSQAVIDTTPISYKVHITNISLTDGTKFVPVYQGNTLVDLAVPTAVQAAIASGSIGVAPGSYTGVRIELGNSQTFTATASVEGTAVISTKAASNEDATQPGVEPYTQTNSYTESHDLLFAKPLTIKAGDNVQVSVIYDMSGLIDVYQQQQLTPYPIQFGGNVSMTQQNLPMFAFVGPEVTPTTFDVRLSGNPYGGAQDNHNQFHYHLAMVLDPTTKAIMGLVSNFRYDPGYTSNNPPYNFVQAASSSMNPDGTYDLVGLENIKNNVPGAIPEFELKKFDASGNSTGSLSFYGGPPMSGPITMTYTSTRAQ